MDKKEIKYYFYEYDFAIMIIKEANTVKRNRAGGFEMLLADLKKQEEKESFVNLAYLVAKSDGCLGYAELQLINLYLEEMGLEQDQVSLQPISLKHLCGNFPDQRSKQIVYANLLSLASIDGLDNEGKKSILDLIQENLTLSPTEAQYYQDELKVINGSYVPSYVD